MTSLFIALALTLQCGPNGCGMPMRFATSPAPAYAYTLTPPNPIRGERLIQHPTLGLQTAHNAWLDTAGQVHYDYADNPHLKPQSPPAAAGPERQAEKVGAPAPSLPSLSGVLDELHKLRSAVDDLSTLKQRSIGRADGNADADANADAKRGAAPCEKCKTPCPNTGGPCTCKDCHCDILEPEKPLPTIPDPVLPPIYGEVTDGGQPVSNKTHEPEDTCEGECVSYGVDHTKIHPAGPEPRVTTNANPSADVQAFASAVVAPEESRGADLQDDSGNPYLTVIGSEEERERVKRDIEADPELAELVKGYHFNSYPAEHWWAAKHPQYQGGSPTLLVQDRKGNVLWKQHDYTGGHLRLLRKLRQAKHGIREALWVLWLRDRIDEDASLVGWSAAAAGLLLLLVIAPGRRKA